MYEAPGSWALTVASWESGIRARRLPLDGGLSLDGEPADDGRIVAQRGRQPQHDVVELLPLDHLRERTAADGDLDHRLDVGDVHAVAGTRSAVDPDDQVGLADDVEHPHVLDSRDRSAGSS